MGGLFNHFRTPGEMALAVFPGTRQTRALAEIDKALVWAATTPDARLIINMPPQEGKSTRAARDFPLWFLMRRPLSRVVLGSYGDDLAKRNGRLIRNAINNSPLTGLSLARDNKSVSDWRLSNNIGGVRSVGVGGGIAGHAADLLIIDDPIKSQQEADSVVYRERIWDWWNAELANRLSSGAPAVLMQTRWHHDDLAGRLISQHDSRWRVLNIPAQCVDPTTDLLGRREGEYLDSVQKRTLEGWEIRKAEAGSRRWQALFQGSPSPSEGGLIQRDWWHYWTREPILNGRVIQSWDMTFKDTNNSDFVVGQVWAQIGGMMYLLDQVRGRWSFTETCRQVQELSLRWPMAIAKLVEDKANGTAVIDHLSRTIPGLIPVNPREGKVARVNAVTPVIEAGNVLLPDPSVCGWVSDLVEEAAAFPTGSHDDQVDAMSQAISWLLRDEGPGSSEMYDIG